MAAQNGLIAINDSGIGMLYRNSVAKRCSGSRVDWRSAFWAEADALLRCNDRYCCERMCRPDLRPKSLEGMLLKRTWGTRLDLVLSISGEKELWRSITPTSLHETAVGDLQPARALTRCVKGPGQAEFMKRIVRPLFETPPLPRSLDR